MLLTSSLPWAWLKHEILFHQNIVKLGKYLISCKKKLPYPPDLQQKIFKEKKNHLLPPLPCFKNSNDRKQTYYFVWPNISHCLLQIIEHLPNLSSGKKRNGNGKNCGLCHGFCSCPAWYWGLPSWPKLEDSPLPVFQGLERGYLHEHIIDTFNAEISMKIIANRNTHLNNMLPNL